MKKLTLSFLIACVASVGCGEKPQEHTRSMTQQSLADPVDVNLDDREHVCPTYYASCTQMCYPLLVDPGQRGYCCQGFTRTTCKEAGLYTPGDKDNDGVLDPYDNCVFTPNADQANNDIDDKGNIKPDQYGDVCDNCPNHYNPNQENADYDHHGDACDNDWDGDGLLNMQDLCPWKNDPTNADTDGDHLGDACDDDDDNDGVLDLDDNCRLVANPRQRNFDTDGHGNVCDPDMDNDGVLNIHDNCPSISNPSQLNTVSPGTIRGDACSYEQLTLWRVRKDGINAGLTKTEFQPWATYDVPHAIQNKTLLATHSEPLKNKTRNLVFIAAGQQDLWGNQRMSHLTGQQADFRWGPQGGVRFPKYQASIPYQINQYSFMSSIVHQRGRGDANSYLDAADSFMAVAFDAQFEFGYLYGDKIKIVNAYYDWLTSKVRPNNLDSVLLSGHSRGGCLVAQLAQKFQAEFPNIRLIVQLYDPVCSGDEMGVNVYNWKHNPMVSTNWHAFTTDITAQFTPPNGADRSRLRIYNILSGESVWGTHSFTDINDLSTLSENGTVWYERHWTNRSHVGVEFDSLINGSTHYFRSCKELGCYQD